MEQMLCSFTWFTAHLTNPFPNKCVPQLDSAGTRLAAGFGILLCENMLTSTRFVQIHTTELSDNSVSDTTDISHCIRYSVFEKTCYTRETHVKTITLLLDAFRFYSDS